MNISPHLQRAIEMELKEAYLKGKEDEKRESKRKKAKIHVTNSLLESARR